MDALRRPRSLVAVVIAVQVLLYAAVALPGSFYLDDLASTNRAAASDLTLTYLRGPSGHHLAPGSMVWLWFQAHVMPFNHTGAVLMTLAVQAGVTWLLWRLLRELFGDRYVVLAPLAVYALSPLHMPTFAWWIQSICLLPVHLAIVGATLQHVRYVRTGRLRHALAGGAWVLFGLMFWEKAVLAAALPGLLTLVALTSGSLWARLRVMLRMWPSWVCLLLPVVAFIGIYSRQERQPARSVGLGEVLHLLGDSTANYVVPSLLGGPWTWTRTEFYGIAAPAAWQAWLACLAVGVAVVASIVRRRAAAWGWLLLVLYVPLSLAPIALGRLAQYGVAVGRDSRYLTDIALVAAVAIGLVLMPTCSVGQPAAAPARIPVRRFVAPALAGAVFLASAIVSGVTFADRWHENPTGDYLAALQSDLPVRGSANLYDGQLPNDVLSPFYSPVNTLSSLLGQLPGKARFSDGMVPQSVVQPDGTVRISVLSAVATTVPGPLKDCGYAVNDEHPTAELPLPSPVFGFVDRTVRVELLLSGPSPVTVVTDSGQPVGDRRTLPRGPVAVVGLVPDGSISGFVVSGVAPGVAACVLKATVGVPKPL